jgi:hypothetical protein
MYGCVKTWDNSRSIETLWRKLRAVHSTAVPKVLVAAAAAMVEEMSKSASQEASVGGGLGV